MNDCIEDEYITEILNESTEDESTANNKLTEVTVIGTSASEDWDDGLTFTAKSSRKFYLILWTFIINLFNTFLTLKY